MTVKELLETLKDLPEDYSVCLSHAFLHTTKDNKMFTMVFDIPIKGLASHSEDKEVRFVLQEKKLKDVVGLPVIVKEFKKFE